MVDCVQSDTFRTYTFICHFGIETAKILNAEADDMATKLSELGLRVALPNGVTSIGETRAVQGGAAAAAPQSVTFSLSGWVNHGEADLLVWKDVDLTADYDGSGSSIGAAIKDAVADLEKTGEDGLSPPQASKGLEK